MTDYEKICDFANLYRAYRRSRLGKRGKLTVAKFEANLLENLNLLSEELRSGTYRPQPYHVFYVHEPKTRLIMANAFRDKIVQHSLCDNVLEPALKRSLILENFAVQAGKGTHFALNRLRDDMRSYFFSRKAANDAERRSASLPPLPTHLGGYADGWALKADVSKYFYSVPHAPLKAQLRRRVADEKALRLIDMIIDTCDDPGIPMGNQTSQWFAIAFLSGLDHFVKERLRVKHYGRYMDDIYLIHDDKEYLRRCRMEIERYLEGLGLKLNQKTHIFPLRNGIDFCGFHSYVTDTGKIVRKVRKASKERAKRKMRGQKKKLDAGEIELSDAEKSYGSWRSHASHGNSYYLIRSADALFKNIFKESKRKWRNE